MIRLIVTFVACVLGSAMALAQPSESSQPSDQDGLGGKLTIDPHLRSVADETYCDVIAINRGIGWVTSVNYSTFKVGKCSVESILSLTAASVSAQMATISEYDHVLVTGPYYYTMSINSTQVFNPFISLGDLRFTAVSRSEFNLLDAIKNPKEAWRWYQGQVAYNPIRTFGDVNFIWFSGARVYMLVSDKGEIFVMTGINHRIALGERGVHLKNLGEYLNLPKGWKFESKELTRALTINSHVLENADFKRMIDEFGNLYIDLKDSDGLFK
jgi:hypothetical protein